MQDADGQRIIGVILHLVRDHRAAGWSAHLRVLNCERKQIDEDAAHADKYGSKGLAYIKIDEAGALRFQARQDARLGDRDRVCDNLGDAEDRYEDARDRLDECGLRVASIDLKSALRSVRQEKRFFRCD